MLGQLNVNLFTGIWCVLGLVSSKFGLIWTLNSECVFWFLKIDVTLTVLNINKSKDYRVFGGKTV